MKIDESTVQAVSSEEFKTLAFRVDQKMAQIIFRDKLYSAEGKIRVIVQEYMANARDAHRVAGKSDTPIDVTLPTNLAPEFIVRDYGNGIPPNIIEDIFVVYGASTKKNSNLENGGYGIGAKCAFSYVNAFSVTTTVSGVRYIYAASIDSDGMNQFTLLDSGPATGPDGTEVRVPIKASDISQLRGWVAEVTHAWSPRPNITNGTLEYRHAENESSGERWELYHQCSPFAYRMFFKGITVTVDDIPYTMTSDQSRAIGGTVQILYNLLVERMKCLVMHFRVGEVTIPPQRESIDITPRTKNAITAAVDKFIQTQIDLALNRLKVAVTQLEKVALALDESFELQVARSIPGVFRDDVATAGRAFHTADAGIRVYEARFNEKVFRDFTEMATTSLAKLAKPRVTNKFVVDTKGKKMSPSEIKRLIRSECDISYGDVFIVAIHDMAAFAKNVEVDHKVLAQVGGYETCERDVVPAGPRARLGGHFFVKEYTVRFSEYDGKPHVESKRTKMEELPSKLFVDVENGQPLYQGKPITLDRLCELALLHNFLKNKGQLYTEYLYGWEDRFNGAFKPSDHVFLEDALVDEIENVLDLSADDMRKMAMESHYRYKTSPTWPALSRTDWVDSLCTKLGYNTDFCNMLQRVICLEEMTTEEDSEKRKYIEKICGLIDDDTRKSLDTAFTEAIKQLYDVRDEFAAVAFSTPVTPILLASLSSHHSFYIRKDGERVALSTEEVLLDNLKNHKPINPMFKATP